MKTQTIDMTEQYAKVRSLARRFLSTSSRVSDSEDIASEVFLRLYESRHWEKWDSSKSSLETWVWLGVKSQLGKLFDRLSTQSRKPKLPTIIGDMFDYASSDRGEAEWIMDLRILLEGDSGNRILINTLTYREAFSMLLQGHSLKGFHKSLGVSYKEMAKPKKNFIRFLRDQAVRFGAEISFA